MYDLCDLSWRKPRTFEGKLLWMGVPRYLFVIIGALLALEPPIIVRAGGGGAEATSCVSDAIAASATLIIK